MTNALTRQPLTRAFASKGRRLPTGTLAVALGLMLVTFVLPPAASAKVVWKVKGGGFGHGVGLSQYGAQGLATEGGSNWRQIVGHYYRGTKISALGESGSRPIRVLLAPYQPSVSFTGADSACGLTLRPKRVYSATRRGKGVALNAPSGSSLGSCGSVLTVSGGDSVKVVGEGAYRGSLQVRPSSVPGTVNAINAVDVEDYLRGVVPLESPSSWDIQALRAQAVVARSYALASKVGGKGFDLYDTTASQVYGGVGAEQPRTDRAVADTSGRVVTHKGRTIAAYFFSTSGGHTEDNENVWGGEPRPYLRGVPDPFDSISPLHRWTVTLSQARLTAGLGDLVRGKLVAIRVLSRGASPRILRAKVVGTGGTSVATGQQLMVRLGLRDAPYKLIILDGGR